MAGLQFFGKQSVLQAYRSRGIDTWAIFQQKSLNNAGNTEAMLSSFLDMLGQHGAGCLYTLKVYSGIDEPNEITDNTPSNGSFNFKLGEALGVAISGTGNSPTGTMEQMIMAKLSGIIAKDVTEAMDRRLNGSDDEDDEEFSIGAIIKPYIKEPERLVGLIRELRGFFSGAAVQPMEQPARVAGLTFTKGNKAAGPAPAVPKAPTDAEQLEKLGAALDVLGRHDPKIVEHLCTLADLAVSDPGIFKSIIKKFDLL